MQIPSIQNPQSKIQNGFTLIELLIVVGIIVLLIGLVMPAVIGVYRSSERSRVAADLQTISAALEAYRQDFGDYPRSSGLYGAQLLCWALIAPGNQSSDGSDGPGFRPRGTQGRVYGPYLLPDKFKLSRPAPDFTIRANRAITPADNTSVILDRFGYPILYYPARNPSPTNIYSNYVAASTQSLYNYNDNGGTLSSPMTVGSMQAFLTGNSGGTVTPSCYTGPYLLWSAGPDGYFGPVNSSNAVSTAKTDIQNCDDITNAR